MLQMELFEKPYTDMHKQHGIKLSFPPVKDPTFEGGMNESVHRWFRLTPSYSPELVRFLFRWLECDKSTVVLDPFLGKGTTLIECKKLGYPGIGIEVNPLLFEVSKRSTEWEFDLDKLKNTAVQFMKLVEGEVARNYDLTCEQYCEGNRVTIPMIHNPFRWWKNHVLKDLLILRTLLTTEVPDKLRSPFWIALCTSVIECANIHRNHPTISFDDNHNRSIDVVVDFRNKLTMIIRDLEELAQGRYEAKVLAFLGDSVRELGNIVRKPVDRVITSPPYPNRFSYIHTTRPQLYFMELLNDIESATEIDLRAVGGTWGRATSVLMNKEIQPHKDLVDVLDFRTELLCRSVLMCNYATHYFNSMFAHMRMLRPLVNDAFRGAYVVGNSRLSHVNIHTELYLAKMFEKARFRVEEIMFFRRRGGKKRLYESAVCVKV